MTQPILDVLTARIGQQFSLDKILAMFEIEVDSHIVKKNRRPIFRGKYSRPFIGKSKELFHAEKNIERQLHFQANRQKLSIPFTGRLWTIFHFYFTKDQFFCHDRKGNIDLNRIRETLPDLSNLYELPADSLQRCGIIENDSHIDSHDLSRRLVGPRTKLDIFLLRADNEWKPKQAPK